MNPAVNFGSKQNSPGPPAASRLRPRRRSRARRRRPSCRRCQSRRFRDSAPGTGIATGPPAIFRETSLAMANAGGWLNLLLRSQR